LRAIWLTSDKQVLIKADESAKNSPLRAVSEHIQSLAFFGTPFQDSEALELPDIIQQIAKLYKLESKHLGGASEVLRVSFPTTLTKRTDEDREVRVVVFCEGRITKGIVS
jgi:hypothetical protein